MYRIIHPMNNNVALVQNELQQELIVIGSGIAFGKKKNDLVADDKVEKVFRLNTDESRENFMALLKNVPLDFITTTYEVIDTLSKKYAYPVQEYIYVTLTDHIFCSYQAVQQGRYKYSDLPDVSAMHPIPYKIAKEAIEIFRKRLLDQFPEDEVNRIAYHFINAQGEMIHEQDPDVQDRQVILKAVEEKLAQNGLKRKEENSHFYDRFMIHLNYFLDSLDKGREDPEGLSEMEQLIQLSYPKAYEISHQIYQTIAEQTGAKISPNEKVYLALHIQRLL